MDLNRFFGLISLIIGSLLAAGLTGCQEVLHYTAKVPENYNAALLSGELIHEENGIKFHYSCNSMTGKSFVNNIKPHRGARFYIVFETDEPITNIQVVTCRFKNKKLKYAREKNYPPEELGRQTGNGPVKYEIWIDDFVPENLFDGLFGFHRLKGTEYEIEFTVNYNINNIPYVSILKGIFWCYYVSGPVWLWT
jgi:hypothetical protein